MKQKNGKTTIGLVIGILLFATSMPAFADDRGYFITTVSHMITRLDSFIFGSVTFFGYSFQWVVLWMMLPMLFLTLYFRFINLYSFKRAWDIIRGKYYDDTAPGEVSQFQALSTALSGTVGLGNIAGVAAAISIGGPGATFWMIIIGLFAMSLKFAECTLGVKYRVVHANGTVSGGPMYYLERGLKRRGGKWAVIGKTLAWSYALFAIPSILQIAQVNQAYEALDTVFHFNAELYQWLFGIFIASLTAIVIIGGIRSIANVTSKLVPLMATIYIGAALTILIGQHEQIPAAFMAIFDGAWSPDGIKGGIVGVIIIGMKRAVYSTEAGLGSSTIAHAAAKTREPVSEGMVALLEPFIDTVVISTMTALVIVITHSYSIGQSVEGISMTSAAFGSVISWFPLVLALAAFMFAFSTIISWGYYSSKLWGFLFNESAYSTMIFKIVFCVALIPGAVFSLKEVYMLMDSTFFLMAIPNIIGIYLMAPELKADLKSYLSRLKSGEIQPTKETAPPKGTAPSTE